MKLHAFQRKSAQFIMLKCCSASVHSIFTLYTGTSSSLSSDLLRISSAVIIEHAHYLCKDSLTRRHFD